MVFWSYSNLSEDLKIVTYRPFGIGCICFLRLSHGVFICVCYTANFHFRLVVSSELEIWSAHSAWSSCVSVMAFAAPWTAARQAPLSMDSPGTNAGAGCHALLQGVFPTPGSKLRWPTCWCKWESCETATDVSASLLACGYSDICICKDF